MEQRLIDRDWLSAECVRAILDPQEALDFLLARIKNAKPIDAAPVVHARWEYDRPNHYKCSVCETMWSGVVQFMNFCPNCGAKMDGGAEGEG